MKNYNKNVISSYQQYLNANNLYGWVMNKKLPIGEFVWVRPESYTEDLIKSYNDNDDYGAILEVDIEYPKELSYQPKDLPFSPERRKINKIEKLVLTLEKKEKYVVHITVLKQALSQGLILIRIIELKQEVWLKPYIDMNTKLRTEVKSDFKKDFFKLMNNFVFRKTMENVRNHRDIEMVTTNERRRKLMSKPNYHTSKHFSKN